MPSTTKSCRSATRLPSARIWSGVTTARPRWTSCGNCATPSAGRCRGASPCRRFRWKRLSLQATVVNRIKAEERLSFGVWLQDAFADMHLVYAGLSAVAAAIACVAITLGMMRFATNERPDSTAAMVRMFATPGSNLYPVSASPRVRMPRALDEPIWVDPGRHRRPLHALGRRYARGARRQPRMLQLDGRTMDPVRRRRGEGGGRSDWSGLACPVRAGQHLHRALEHDRPAGRREHRLDRRPHDRPRDERSA